MRRVVFDVDLFRGGAAGRASGERVLRQLLAALVVADIEYLTFHPRAPMLYDAGVRYRREPVRSENFVSIPALLERKWGDCEDLASWRAAELRVRFGERARVLLSYHAIELEGGGTHYQYHIRVRRADGRIEDPSAILGMGRGG